LIENGKLWSIVPVRNKHLKQLQSQVIRLCVPVCFRLDILQAFHDLSHPGFLRTLETIRAKCVWPNLTTDVKTCVLSCEKCAQIKRGKSLNYGIHAQAARSFNELISFDHHQLDHMDGTKHSNKYVLTITEHFSLNTLYAASRGTSAVETAQVLYDRYLTVYGWPLFFLCDQHKSYVGQLMTSLMKLVPESKHLRSSPRRALGNAISESMNKNIIKYIRAAGQQADWPNMLSTIEMAGRLTVASSTQCSPFFCMYGT